MSGKSRVTIGFHMTPDGSTLGLTVDPAGETRRAEWTSLSIYAHPAILTGILDDSSLPPLTAIGSPRVQPNGLGGEDSYTRRGGRRAHHAGRTRTRRRDDRAHGHGRCMKRKREPSTARPRTRGPVPTGACRNRARPGCRHPGTSVGRGSLSPGLFDLSADGLNDHLATTTSGNTGSFRGSRPDARTRKNARGPVGAGCIRCRLVVPRADTLRRWSDIAELTRQGVGNRACRRAAPTGLSTDGGKRAGRATVTGRGCPSPKAEPGCRLAPCRRGRRQTAGRDPRSGVSSARIRHGACCRRSARACGTAVLLTRTHPASIVPAQWSMLRALHELDAICMAASVL